VKQFIEAPDRRLVVLRLDETPVPALVSDLKWIDMRSSTDVGLAVDVVMGFEGKHRRIKAMQEFFEESGLEVGYAPGYGAFVGCPRCGAGANEVEPWLQTDYERDDTYAGARCNACGWEDGGEI
jgi:hypothetical protein